MPYSYNETAEGDPPETIGELRQGVYRFIDSTDLREHLEKTDYQFSDRNIAYLIWNCDSISIRERHRAWKILINAADDLELSAYLKQVIELEDRLLNMFIDSEGADCSCIGYTVSGETIELKHECGNTDGCVRQFMQEKEIKQLEISKKISDSITAFALMLPDGSISRIDAEGISEEEKRLHRIINSYAFKFSCPFQEGEYLKMINGIGVFADQPLKYIESRYEPEYGMLTECEGIDAEGDKCILGISLLDLERYS
jgi:hypothetical protein